MPSASGSKRTRLVLSKEDKTMVTPNSVEVPPPDLGHLGVRVRLGLSTITHATTTALKFAFNVGDDLRAAKAAVGHGNWLHWLAAETGLSERSAERYMQLSVHREHINRHIRHTESNLSIRGALALIGSADRSYQPRKKSPLSKTPWVAATLEERARYLSSIPLTEWLEAMPPEWRAEIVDRVDGLRASRSTDATATMH
jgi:hypothetical protein